MSSCLLKFSTSDITGSTNKVERQLYFLLTFKYHSIQEYSNCIASNISFHKIMNIATNIYIIFNSYIYTTKYISLQQPSEVVLAISTTITQNLKYNII